MPGTPSGGAGAGAGMAPQLGHMGMGAMQGNSPTAARGGGYYPPSVPVMTMGPHGQPVMMMSSGPMAGGGGQSYGYHGQQVGAGGVMKGMDDEW